jgi:hypothetical protein
MIGYQQQTSFETVTSHHSNPERNVHDDVMRLHCSPVHITHVTSTLHVAQCDAPSLVVHAVDVKVLQHADASRLLHGALLPLQQRNVAGNTHGVATCCHIQDAALRTHTAQNTVLISKGKGREGL